MRNAQKKKEAGWQKIVTADDYNLYQDRATPTHFSVRFRKSDKWMARRFDAPSVKLAMEKAPKVAGQVIIEKRENFRLADAFNEALGQAKRGEPSRKGWDQEVKRFMKWLNEHYPDCTYWHCLDRRIIREYLAGMGAAADHTKRLRLQPIKQTSRYMNAEYDYPDVAANLKTGTKLKKTPPMVRLPDVVSFLDFLRDNHPNLEAGAALQGLAGLQLQEATRLTWDKIDLDHGLVEVSGEVKNEYRNRVIPLADRVLEALQRAYQRHAQAKAKAKIRPVREHVILSSKGLPYDEGSWFNYSKDVSGAMRKWNAGIDWTPKDLRNCLPTYAATEGIHNVIWEQYIGHAPHTVTATNYIPRLGARSKGEREALGEQMAIFYQHVVEPVNRARRGEGKKRLNYFEPREPRTNRQVQTES